MVNVAALIATMVALLVLVVGVVIRSAVVEGFGGFRSLVSTARRWRREARDRELLAKLGVARELPEWVGGDARCWHDHCALVVVRNKASDSVEPESWLEACKRCGAQRGEEDSGPASSAGPVEWTGGDEGCAHLSKTRSVSLNTSNGLATVEGWDERCNRCRAERGGEVTAATECSQLPEWVVQDIERTAAEWEQLEAEANEAGQAAHDEEMKERETEIARRAAGLSRVRAEAILAEVATVRAGLSCGLPVDQCGVCSGHELGHYDHLLKIEGPAANQRLAELCAIRSIAP